jgi:chromosome segregation ATPase
MKFVDETDKNEEELHKYEKELNEKKFQIEKASKTNENMFEPNEDFLLDEKEVALGEQLPVLENQFNTLNGSKTRLDTDLSLVLEKNQSLSEDLLAKQKELEELRIQIVRSPEKIAKMQEMAKKE